MEELKVCTVGQAQAKTERFDRVGEEPLPGNRNSPSAALEKYKGCSVLLKSSFYYLKASENNPLSSM